MRGQQSFFDIDDRLKRLSDLGDQLETFRSAVDFELFRPELNAALSYTDRTEGGRPPFDPVLMFKILVIQATNNLSDERAEFLINDRLSFMRFLGLGLEDRVPDARTIWLFREKLTTAGAIKRLFEQFDAMLRQAGYIAMSGQIVDASLVAAPRQRNTDDEKKAIKEGRIPPNWKAKPAKLRHKDRDARWTVKFTKAKPREDGSTPPVDLAIPLFGYQNHVSIDRRFGFIRRWAATDAAGKKPKGRACPRQCGGPTMRNRKSARVSSMCSPSKRIGWGYSSELSGSPEQRLRSEWPISSTTSNALSSCARSPSHDRLVLRKATHSTHLLIAIRLNQ